MSAASIKQWLYWNAPYTVKTWMASWNARRLDRVRYGLPYERACRGIAERDGWTRAEFAAWQQSALRHLMTVVAPRTRYYRAMFAEHGINPAEITEPSALQRLPVLRKSVVRDDPLSLVDESLDQRELLVLHTSGTTGTPLTLYRDVHLNAAAFAYLDERWHRVAGVRRREDRSISIGGHLVAASARRRPPFWVHNRRWNQLYMSSFHLSPACMDAYVVAIRDFAADYIEGYPSSIYAIARHMIDRRLSPIPVKACFTTAETLHSYQREAIGEAFACRTFDQYGCGEMVVFAAECQSGSMHLSPEFGIVEVLDDDGRAVPDGHTGHLVCTGLINQVQLFIRYQVGDLGSLRPGECACGSPLPMLGHVEGRNDSVLITPDGRRIGRLDSVFKDTPGVAEAQIIQEDDRRFRVRIVPGSRYSSATERQVISELTKRIGDVEIRIETVERIERTASGKFPAVLNKLGDRRAVLHDNA